LGGNNGPGGLKEFYRRKTAYNRAYFLFACLSIGSTLFYPRKIEKRKIRKI